MPEEPENRGDKKGQEDEVPSQDEGDTIDDDGEEDDEESEGEEDDEEAEEEPKLKYARLTSSLGSVYRNGDATSTFLVAGDKMVGLMRVLLKA